MIYPPVSVYISPHPHPKDKTSVSNTIVAWLITMPDNSNLFMILFSTFNTPFTKCRTSWWCMLISTKATSRNRFILASINMWHSDIIKWQWYQPVTLISPRSPLLPILLVTVIWNLEIISSDPLHSEALLN